MFQCADLLVSRLARTQHGIVTRKEALVIGLSERSIDERLAFGGWRTLHPGVYLLPGVPPSRSADLLAALKWAGEDAALWGPTAGEVFRLHGLEPGGHIHVASHRNLASPVLRCHRLRPSDAPCTTKLDGLKVTRVERTLFDMCAALPLGTAGLSMDDALRRRLTTLDRLNLELEERQGRGARGTRAFRRLLEGRDLNDQRVRTVFETKMLRILRRIDLPGLVADHPVTIGRTRYVLDLAYPLYRLGIECHSIDWHLGHDWLRKDVERDRRLKRAGWTVLYYSWDDVHFRPKEVQAEVEHFLSRSFPIQPPAG